MNWDLLFCDSVYFALFGGVAIQLLSLLEIKSIPKTDRPDLKDLFFWLPLFIGPLIGGGLAFAYVYPDTALEPTVAINIGVSAPLILRSMAAINPFDAGGIDPGEGA